MKKLKINRMKTTLYRNKIGTSITYSETEQQTIDYSKSSKSNKKVLISFIRTHYPNTDIRSIIKQEYKAIFKDGYLIGVQYKLIN